MLQIPLELIPLPLVFSANVTGDPEPPDGATGDPEIPPGEKIKPPTGSQPATSESEGGIKPPTATDEPESNAPDPGGGDDIIIKGG